MNDTLKASLAARERGWRPFPVDHPGLPQCASAHRAKPCDGKRGKHPVGRWSTMTASDQADKMLAHWFGGDLRNIGIGCKGSGLLVIDEDAEDALARAAADRGEVIPQTYRVRTSRGWHYYFADPDGEFGNSAGALGLYGIDVRGSRSPEGPNGGYVVGAGSVHVSGHVYVAEDPGADVAPIPAWIAAALREGATPAAENVEGERAAPDGPDARVGSEADAWTEYRAALDAVRGTKGESFRRGLYKAAWFGYRLVGLGAALTDPLNEDALLAELDAVIRDTWGADADVSDQDHVNQGRRKAEQSPWQLLGGRKLNVDHSPPPAPAPRRRRLRLTRASAVRPRIARWLWEPDVGRIPSGELSLVAGRGNVGKSPFTLWIAAELTRGTLPGANYGKPCDVLIYASEDSLAHTIVPRLMAAGADLDRVHFLEGTVTEDDPERPLDWTGDLPLIAEAIAETGAAALILDPLAVVYTRGTDTHNSQAMREALQPLVELAHRTGAAIIGITHFNKAKTTDVAALLSGAHGLRDVARAVIVCAQDGDGTRVIGQDKNNLGRAGDDVACLSYAMESRTVPIVGDDGVTELVSQPAFVITGTTDESLADVIGRTGERGEGAATSVPDSVRWLFDRLVDAHPHPVHASVLAREADERGGPKWGTVRKTATRTRLMESHSIAEAGRTTPVWVWSLTEAGSALAADVASLARPDESARTA